MNKCKPERHPGYFTLSFTKMAKTPNDDRSEMMNDRTERGKANLMARIDALQKQIKPLQQEQSKLRERLRAAENS